PEAPGAQARCPGLRPAPEGGESAGLFRGPPPTVGGGGSGEGDGRVHPRALAARRLLAGGVDKGGAGRAGSAHDQGRGYPRVARAHPRGSVPPTLSGGPAAVEGDPGATAGPAGVWRPPGESGGTAMKRNRAVDLMRLKEHLKSLRLPTI